MFFPASYVGFPLWVRYANYPTHSPNYSVKWTAATCHGNLTLSVAAATYLKRYASMKNFRLKPEQIKPLVQGLGSCLATDRILVDGLKVGYCYREAPDNKNDSGWRFFSGDEEQEYIENPDNIGLYSVNTVANYDPQIVPLLSYPEGSAFERNKAGVFVRIAFQTPGEA